MTLASGYFIILVALLVACTCYHGVATSASSQYIPVYGTDIKA